MNLLSSVLVIKRLLNTGCRFQECIQTLTALTAVLSFESAAGEKTNVSLSAATRSSLYFHMQKGKR